MPRKEIGGASSGARFLFTALRGLQRQHLPWPLDGWIRLHRAPPQRVQVFHDRARFFVAVPQPSQLTHGKAMSGAPLGASFLILMRPAMVFSRSPGERGPLTTVTGERKICRSIAASSSG